MDGIDMIMLGFNFESLTPEATKEFIVSKLKPLEWTIDKSNGNYYAKSAVAKFCISEKINESGIVNYILIVDFIDGRRIKTSDLSIKSSSKSADYIHKEHILSLFNL